MARRLRINLDNMPLHIVQRAHNRLPCFFGEQDYQVYLHKLGEALDWAGVENRSQRGRPRVKREESTLADGQKGQLRL